MRTLGQGTCFCFKRSRQAHCRATRRLGKPNGLAALIEDYAETLHHDDTCNITSRKYDAASIIRILDYRISSCLLLTTHYTYYNNTWPILIMEPASSSHVLVSMYRIIQYVA
jgi:hypothetical protein